MIVFGLLLSQQVAPSCLKNWVLRQKNWHWSLGNGTCFFHLACHQVAPISHELDLELVWLVGQILLVEQLLLLVSSNFPFCFSSNFRTQFSCPFVLQWDLWRRSRWHVYFVVQNFSSFQSNNFWDTISWKCFLKDDCIRSSLIEFQSFHNRKIDVDPIFRVLMSFPCIVQVLCTTWCIQVNLVRILVSFVPRINRQEEYCLSLARILTSRC